MTPDDVRAAAERLVDFHERFAPLFGKEQAQDHAYDYVKGLMVCPDRKSVEPIALLVGHGDVSGLQKFINSAPGSTTTSRLNSRPSSTASWSPRRPGRPPASSVSSTSRPSPSRAYTPRAWPGSTTAGSARKTTARSASSSSALPPRGPRCSDHRLYLPKPWCEDTPEARTRRGKAHIPEDVTFRPKARIAAELVRGVVVLGQTRLDWVVADEEYGKAGHFHEAMDELEQRYVVEVPVTTTVWTEDPAGCVPAYGGRGQPPKRPTREGVKSVAAVAAGLPAEAWQTLKVREGACGPLVFEFAAVRVWAMRDQKPGPPVWLLIRRSLEAIPEVKYYISNGGAETPLKVLALVACTRHRVEEYFGEAKTYLGMAQYETRAYVGWHHHMALVAVAHLFVTLTRLRLKKSRRA